MGRIASATTVYARAYLTELGRKYLFNSTKNPRYVTLTNGNVIDKLEISRFSLGDPDINYNLSNMLESGDIPDLSGESEECITGAKGRTLNNLVAPGDGTFSNEETSNSTGGTSIDVSYDSTYKPINIDLKLSDLTIPTVIGQQLLYYINGILQNNLVTHGTFSLSLSTNGSIIPDNDGIYRIVMKEPTLNEVGYRLVIIPPTVGNNWDKATFQIEKGTMTTIEVAPTPGGIITPSNIAPSEGNTLPSGTLSS